MKGWKQTDHRNLILARKSEEWIIDQIREFAESPAVVERVLEKAIANTSKNLQPQRDALALTQSALRKNQDRTEQMFAMMESDKVNDSLLAMLNQRATELRGERERLEEEQRKLSQELAPISAGLEPGAFREKMVTFAEQVEEATPEEKQRLLRLIVRRLEWMPNGEHRVEFHYIPDAAPQRLITEKTSPDRAQDWLQTGIRTGCSGRTRTSDQSVNSRPLYH